jgi:glycosyltransferase involved in cell wall biosynthesis
MTYAITPYGRNGPSSRVRVYEWLDRVAVPFVVSGYISQQNARPSALARRPGAVLAAERRLRLIAAARPERLLLHREASPLSRGGLERRLLGSAEFAVYDFDDALQWDWGEGGLFRRLAPKAPKAHAAVRCADRVIAGNAVLADWASQFNRDVVVIPSCVSPAEYRQKTVYDITDPPRLGWIGSADNEAYLRLVAPALSEVHRRTGARLTLIGTTRPTLGVLERIIDRVAWSEAVQRELLAGMDVGIAPVPDEPYTRGKCGYKLLQYGAASTPVVASPIGVNRQILAQFGAPAPADTREWADALVDLLERPASARAELGRRAHEVTQREYSFDAWLATWAKSVGLSEAEGGTRASRVEALPTQS